MDNLPRYGRAISPREIRSLLPPTAEKPVVLEIGCNDGTDTENLLTIPGVMLHAFECDPRPIARFKDRFKGREVVNLALHEYAVSREDGTATFHQSGGTTKGAHLQDWDLSGSLKKPLAHTEYHKWCKFEHTITVETRRLDTWLTFFNPPTVDFIWLDVQGAEADVFAGGPETLARTRFIYTEFNHKQKPLYEGDLNLEQTIAALGPVWEPIGVYEGYNVLLKNNRF